MRKARVSIAVAGMLSLGLGVGCSNGASSPPMAASGGSPPTAAREPNAPATSPPASEANAAGSPAPASVAPTKPVKSSPAKPDVVQPSTPREVDPHSGLPIGPGLPAAGDPSFRPEIPMDSRAVNQSTSAVPVSGGTLVITPDDLLMIAADPDRDRVSIVNSWTRGVTHVALEPGDEPGRIALDDAGRAHVALRRGGAVATIDLASRKVVERRAVCAAPRGIAHDAARNSLVVACATGELVTLPETGTSALDRQLIGNDLRDVLPTSSGTFVTRLKTAELVSLDASAKPVTAVQPQVRQGFFPDGSGALRVDTLAPQGARRTVPTKDGFVMLHAGGRNGDIPTKPGDPTKGGGSPYGGSGSCSGVVGSAITEFDREGKVVVTAQFPATLAVDIAVSPVRREYAIAVAGAGDPFAPNPLNGGQALPPTNPDGTGLDLPIVAVLRYDPSTSGDLKDPHVGPCVGMEGTPLPAPATSVAYLSDGRLVAQTREPAKLWIVPRIGDPFTDGTVTPIDLGGASVLDTGHEIFHRDAGAGVACASCHIEGGDDGHVWNFVEMGPRRTQSINVGLEGTEPFHWIGDMRDLPTLMDHVFVGRMGGAHQSSERLNALAKWMFAVKAPVPARAATDAAVLRGRELFVGDAECGKCHTGPKFTNNETVDVGTGLALQVPSLVAVAYRGPWIHNGCAKTLRDRFDPACGGATHGKVAQLNGQQIDDLVAFLESL